MPWSITAWPPSGRFRDPQDARANTDLVERLRVEVLVILIADDAVLFLAAGVIDRRVLFEAAREQHEIAAPFFAARDDLPCPVRGELNGHHDARKGHRTDERQHEEVLGRLLLDANELPQASIEGLRLLVALDFDLQIRLLVFHGSLPEC